MAKSLLLPYMKRRKVECNVLTRSVRNKMAIFLSDQDDGDAAAGAAAAGPDAAGVAAAGDAAAVDALGQGQVEADGQGDQPQPGGGGERQNLFPHESHVLNKRRCKGCVEALPRDGNKAARAKMYKINTQCSMCQVATM